MGTLQPGSSSTKGPGPPCHDSTGPRTRTAWTHGHDAVSPDRRSEGQHPAKPARVPRVPVAPGPQAPKRREIDSGTPGRRTQVQAASHDYVTDIQANYPDIWEAGGGIRAATPIASGPCTSAATRPGPGLQVVSLPGLGRPSTRGLRTSRRHGPAQVGRHRLRAGTHQRRSSEARPGRR